LREPQTISPRWVDSKTIAFAPTRMSSPSRPSSSILPMMRRAQREAGAADGEELIFQGVVQNAKRVLRPEKSSS